MESLMSRSTFSGIIITNGTVHTDSESSFPPNITGWRILVDTFSKWANSSGHFQRMNVHGHLWGEFWVAEF